MTTCHLIADLNFTLLSNIYSNYFIYTRWKLIAVSTGKYFNVNNNTVFAVRDTHWCISNLSCLFAKDSSQKSFLGCKLCFTLRCNFADKNIAWMNLSTDTDNTVFVKVTKSILTNVRNISCYFFRTEFCITSLYLMLNNVDWGINVVSYNLFINKNSILIVITFPCHKADKGILTKWNFTVAGCRTVCNNLSVLNFLVKRNDRTLINACSLVRTLELNKLILVNFTRLNCNFNSVGIDCSNSTATLSNNNYTGVVSCFIFHTRSYNRSNCLKKRYSLTLHVSTHKCTVGVIVFKERNHCCSNWNYHLRRYVHIIYSFRRKGKELITATASNSCVCKSAVFIKRFVSLSYNVIILNIGSHINNLVGYNACFLINLAVWSFDKAIFIKTAVTSKIRDKTDIRAFRCLYRTHTAVVGIVYVTNFETCTVSWKTAGTESRKSSLMSKLCKRIVLVHKLRKRRWTEELFNCGNYRTNIDKSLRCDSTVVILSLKSHTLTNNSFHSCKTDSELILKKFADSSDSTVTKVVDIVGSTYAVCKVNKIRHACKNIICCNMLWNKVVCSSFNFFFKSINVVAALFKNFGKNSIWYHFVNTKLFAVEINVFVNINHTVRYDFYFLAVCIYKCNHNACIFNFNSSFFADFLACICKKFTLWWDDRLSKNSVLKSIT